MRTLCIVGLLSLTLPAVEAVAGTYSFLALGVPAGSYGTYANGINDAGQVVGEYYGAPGSSTLTIYGFRMTSGAFETVNAPTALTAAPPTVASGVTGTSYRGTILSGINNSDHLVGTYFDSAGLPHGFVDTDGTFVAVDVPGSNWTYANGINNLGSVTGNYAGDFGFIASPIGGFSTINFPDSLNRSNTFAYGINDDGQVAGSYYAANSDGSISENGFVGRALSNGSGFSFTPVHVPGALSERPNAINSRGDVAGFFTDSSGTHGFVDVGGVFTTLDAPNSTATYIFGMNNLGQVVGDFSDAAGNHPFVATPVPIPDAFWLLSSGLAFLPGIRRKSVTPTAAST